MYGPDKAGEVQENILNVVNYYQPRISRPKLPPPNLIQPKISEEDAILITYGDMISTEHLPPLKVLGLFLEHYVTGLVSTIHILPFYPYTSDDGFSVVSFKEVDKRLGSWRDIDLLGKNFRLMFDAVINHVSAEHKWFRAFLAGDPIYSDFFIEVVEGADLSQVFRPRALPLTAPFRTASGIKQIWTTFSSDQVDLNFANPDVLVSVLEVLLFYASKQAEFIRLDAIAYLWKELGTLSINLPQTHAIIQIFRLVLDLAAPQIILITETNVAHEDNIAYFGDGSNEAHLVYNFSLPPLVIQAFHSGSSRILSTWARQLQTPSNRTYFFNFLASHDGIGLVPARGLLEEQEIEAMAERIKQLGGFVSYRTNSDGSTSPYELNINFLDALRDPDEKTEDPDFIARRFLTSQAIMLALKGVPGIYFHSLFGSTSWFDGVEDVVMARRINRQKLNVSNLMADLSQKNCLRSIVYEGYKKLLTARRRCSAFHPSGKQTILDTHPSLFSLLRESPDGSQYFLGFHSVANRGIKSRIRLGGLVGNESQEIIDLIMGDEILLSPERTIDINLPPYGCIWLGLSRSE